MFPEEIIRILKKYQSDNTEIIDDINMSIEHIKSLLQQINKIIAKKTYDLMQDEEPDNNVNELMDESKIIRKYIKSIQSIDVWKENNYNIEISKEFTSPIFNGNVKVFLLSDDLCPFCNIKLSQHIIHYQKLLDNKLERENVSWHWCKICRNLFCIDYEIEDFNFDNTNIVLNKTKYENIIPLDICSVVILKNTLKCSSNHDVVDVIAKIPTLDSFGNVSYVRVSASYCRTCKRYTILKEDFDKIDNILLCNVIDETQNSVPNDNAENNFELEQNKSLLAQYGYNVQTKKDISKEQRHIILASIIEAQILSKRGVIDHLTTLIERGSKIEKWKLATSKWKEDRDYINSYNLGELPEVILDKIILKYKE